MTQTETDRRLPSLIRAIALSEWAALELHCFLRAAWEFMPFFTRCSDPRLDKRRHHSYKGLLFRRQESLVALI